MCNADLFGTAYAIFVEDPLINPSERYLKLISCTYITETKCTHLSLNVAYNRNFGPFVFSRKFLGKRKSFEIYFYKYKYTSSEIKQTSREAWLMSQFRYYARHFSV